jgi:RNA polymerase sigma-70 factor (ECF subfamily)
MTIDDQTPAVDRFTALRPRLFSIAYRMLGTRADAEDVVQDAWLRWQGSDASSVRSAEAWLVTTVTRLAIDRLRAAKAQREAYVGWWLPEPLVATDEQTPEAAAELAGELSVAFLWVLERLSAEERAAYLLREAFDYDYAEIAALLDKSEATCRQMVHRAAARVRAERPRFAVSEAEHRRLLTGFMQAASSGDRSAIRALLADEVRLVSDGGGKVPSFQRVLEGGHRIANLYWVTGRRLAGRCAWRLVLINGETGLVRYVDGQPESALAFVTDGARIVAIYSIRNPDKLAAIAPLAA